MESIEGDDRRPDPEDPDATSSDPAASEPSASDPADLEPADPEPADQETDDEALEDRALADAVALAVAQRGPGPDEIPLDLQPVLELAAWAYGEHEPPEGQCTCPICGTEGCDPYRWADRILEAVAVLPVMVVKQAADD